MKNKCGNTYTELIVMIIVLVMCAVLFGLVYSIGDNTQQKFMESTYAK